MKNLLRYFLCVISSLIMLPALAASGLPQPTQVSTHAWAWIGPYEAPSKANRGFRMNLGFVVGKDAVAVIDSGYTPAMAEQMLAQIRRITKLPVRYVINTNSQPHRFMGNDVFKKAGAEVIAARDAAERMDNEGLQLAATVTNTLELKQGSVVAPAAPNRLIDPGPSTQLNLGGDITLTVTHFGQAHTRGSLVVEVAPDQTVFAGDILYSGRLLAVLPDSSVSGWIAAYEKLRYLNAKRFVPGHGAVAALSEFELPTYDYLTALKAHMDQAVKDGVDASTASASFDNSKWKHLANFSELAGRNASLTYLECEAAGF